MLSPGQAKRSVATPVQAEGRRGPDARAMSTAPATHAPAANSAAMGRIRAIAAWRRTTIAPTLPPCLQERMPRDGGKASVLFLSPPKLIATLSWASEVERVNAEVLLLRQQMDDILRNRTIAVTGDETTPDPVVLTPSSMGALTSPSLTVSSNGPTSNDYALRMAEGQLHTLGIGRFEPISTSEKSSSNAIQPQRPWFPIQASEHLKALVVDDPLSQMDVSSVTHLISSWVNGLGAMFPIIPPTWLHQKWTQVRNALHLLHTTFAMSEALGAIETLSAHATGLIKMVLANALAAQTSGPNQMAKRLFESIKDSRGKALRDPPTLTNISLLTLVVGLKLQVSFASTCDVRLCRASCTIT